MKWLSRMERKFAPYAVHNVTLVWIMVQSLMWVLIQGKPEVAENLILDRSLLLSGEWWRLLSFVFLPPTLNPIFLLFALWLFYMMGTALEGQWGAIRYNFYLLIGYLATVASVFVAPAGAATNTYLLGSVFLAFAYL